MESKPPRREGSEEALLHSPATMSDTPLVTIYFEAESGIPGAPQTTLDEIFLVCGRFSPALFDRD